MRVSQCIFYRRFVISDVHTHTMILVILGTCIQAIWTYPWHLFCDFHTRLQNIFDWFKFSWSFTIDCMEACHRDTSLSFCSIQCQVCGRNDLANHRAYHVHLRGHAHRSAQDLTCIYCHKDFSSKGAWAKVVQSDPPEDGDRLVHS